MKKLKPVSVRFFDSNDCLGIRMPSEVTSNEWDDPQLNKEVQLFLNVIRESALTANCQLLSPLSANTQDQLQKYFSIENENREAFVVVYQIDDDTAIRLCDRFADRCQKELGYQWEEELVDDSMPDLPQKNTTPLKWAWVAAVVVAFGLMSYFLNPLFFEGATQEDVAVILPDSVFQQNIPGKYSVYQGDVISLMTAEVREKGNKEYQIIVISDYEPVLYDFTVTPDGTLSSVQLGQGEFLYKEKLNKTELVFNNDTIVWKFKK